MISSKLTELESGKLARLINIVEIHEVFGGSKIMFHARDDYPWITSKSTPVTTESKIIFESYQKNEVEDLFGQFSRVKIYSSITPVDLLSHEKVQKPGTAGGLWGLNNAQLP